MSDDLLKQKERRKFIRLSEENLILCEPFKFSQEKSDVKFHSFTKNVGDGGILFDSDNFFDVGTILKIEINFPGWEKYKAEFYKDEAPSANKPLIILGKVIHVKLIEKNIYETGVAFTAVDAGHKMALHKYFQTIRKEKMYEK